MTEYNWRFQRGAGLGVRSSAITQTELLEAENCDMSQDGRVGKAHGHDLVSLVRSSDSTDLIPTDDTRALWYRGSELVLETKSKLYSRQVCAKGSSGGVLAGTVTPAEAADAQAVLDDRAANPRTLDVALPGDAGAAALRSRASRDPDTAVAVMNLPGPRTITLTVEPAAPSKLRWVATEGAQSTAANLPLGTIQRIPGVQDVGQRFVITYIADGGVGGNARLVAVALDLNSPTAPTFDVSTTVLDTLRGAALQAWQTSRNGAISAIRSNGDLRFWDVTSLATQTVVVTSPPPSGAAYYMDHLSAGYPGADIAVTWLSDGDDVHRAVEYDPVGVSLTAEAEYPGVRSSSGRVVALAVPGGAGWLIGWKQDGNGTIPVLKFDPADPLIRVVDLEGADLRLVTEPKAGAQQYTLRRADTDEALSNTLTMGVLAAVSDSGFVAFSNTVVGGVVDATGLYELAWDRTFDAPLALLSATASAVGIAADVTRIVLAYWTSATALRIRVLEAHDDATPVETSVIPGEAHTAGDAIAVGILAATGGGNATVRVHTWLSNGRLYSATIASDTGAITEARVDAFLTVPTFASVFPAGPSPRTVLGVQYAAGSQELWEVDVGLFVRVSPPLVVLAGGDWRERAPWTRTKARQVTVRNHQDNVVSTDAVSVLNEDGAVCTFVASEVDSQGARADIVSTHTERSDQLDPNGLRPRTSGYGPGRAVIAYELASREITVGIWAPGSALGFSTTGLIADAARAWDLKGGATVTTPFWVIAVGVAAGQVDFRVSPEEGVVANFSRATGFNALVDVALHVVVEDDDNILIGHAFTGTSIGGLDVRVGVHRVKLSTGTATLLFNRAFDPAIPTRAVSVHVETASLVNVWLEVVEGTNRRVRAYDVDSIGTVTLLRQELRCALATQLETLAGQAVGAITLLGGEFVDTKSKRSAILLKTHKSGAVVELGTASEVVGRLAVGQVENADERALRPPKTSLTADETGALVMGWQLATIDPETDRADTTVILRWDPNAGPHSPAVLDGVAVGAHGGYPRLYDGQDAWEHDWHELPEVRDDPLVGGGGAMSAGAYTMAMTLEKFDAQGQLYRSAPTFFKTTIVGAGASVTLSAFSLTQTEYEGVARGVQLVFWRTIANGTEFFREKQVPAKVFGTDVIGSGALGAISDEDLSVNEKLDQLIDGVLFSVPTASTDFTALANSRIWTRDPAAPERARYTLASRDFGLGAAFGLHWPGEFVLRHNGPGELRAVTELDGRVYLMADTSVSSLIGDGPTDTGEGAYSTPSRLSVDIGVGGQSAVAVMPDGIAYGAPVAELACQFNQQPHLITRGLTSLSLGEPVEGAYGTTRADVVVYSESTGDVIFADSTQPVQYRFHRETRRWHRWTRYIVRDMAVSPLGQVATLTADGRVLLECADRYDDGGVAYIRALRLPWLFHEPGNPFGNGSLSIVHVVGTAETDHTMTLRARFDYQEAIADELAVQASSTEHGWEYRANGRPGHASSIEIRDDGTAASTLILEAIVVSIADSGARGPDQLKDGQVFKRSP